MHKALRNQCYGTLLMKHMAEMTPNEKYVTLDDTTDNATYTNESKKGFFRRLGLKYLVEGEPEMKGTVKNVLKNANMQIQQYRRTSRK